MNHRRLHSSAQTTKSRAAPHLPPLHTTLICRKLRQQVRASHLEGFLEEGVRAELLLHQQGKLVVQVQQLLHEVWVLVLFLGVLEESTGRGISEEKEECTQEAKKSKATKRYASRCFSFHSRPAK